MPDFVFAYHGGGMPETPEEGAKMIISGGMVTSNEELEKLTSDETPLT